MSPHHFFVLSWGVTKARSHAKRVPYNSQTQASTQRHTKVVTENHTALCRDCVMCICMCVPCNCKHTQCSCYSSCFVTQQINISGSIVPLEFHGLSNQSSESSAFKLCCQTGVVQTFCQSCVLLNIFFNFTHIGLFEIYNLFSDVCNSLVT